MTGADSRVIRPSRTAGLRTVAIVLACVLALSGCAAAATSVPASGGTGSPAASTPAGPIPGASATVPSWFLEPMVDVNTGKSFRISDFSGQVILIDTMATWCPTCQGEMSQVQQLPDMLGASASQLVRISLDVDPNEDATILKKYAAANKFDWYIAIAPTTVGEFLSKNYDVDYLNPPLQPMLVIDKSGGVYGLPFGIKSALSIQKTLVQYLGQ